MNLLQVDCERWENELVKEVKTDNTVKNQTLISLRNKGTDLELSKIPDLCDGRNAAIDSQQGVGGNDDVLTSRTIQRFLKTPLFGLTD